MSTNTDYTAVVRLANRYVPIHVDGEKQNYLSYHFETELKTAQAAAAAFAEMNSIFYDDQPLEFNDPIVSIGKDDGLWNSLYISANRVDLIRCFPKRSYAIADAKKASEERKFVFLPEFEASLTARFESGDIEPDISF